MRYATDGKEALRHIRPRFYQGIGPSIGETMITQTSASSFGLAREGRRWQSRLVTALATVLSGAAIACSEPFVARDPYRGLSGTFSLDSIGSSRLPALSYVSLGESTFVTDLTVIINAAVLSPAGTPFFSAVERDSSVGPLHAPRLTQRGSSGEIEFGPDAAHGIGRDSALFSGLVATTTLNGLGVGPVFGASGFAAPSSFGLMYFSKRSP